MFLFHVYIILGDVMVSSISIHDFFSLKDVSLIDIRSKIEFDSGHIDGAVNIPYEKLISNPSDFLDLEKKYCLYCQKGLTSYSVCNILSKLGYDVVNISGGYYGYILGNN